MAFLTAGTEISKEPQVRGKIKNVVFYLVYSKNKEEEK
jgi:hypothetical protein